MIIQSINPNFLVNETGLRVQIDDGTIVEFYEGDGISIVNRDDIPHLEFKINDSEHSVKIDTREDFESILENLRHVSEFKTKDVELMDAMADEEISTPELVKAYQETQAAQKNKTRIHLPITVEIKTLTTQEKVSHMAYVESTFENPLFGTLVSFGEAPDPMASGAKPANLSAGLDSDEEDDPNDDSSKKEPITRSASDTVDQGDNTASGNKVAEGDDDDDDKKKKDDKKKDEGKDDDDKDDDDKKKEDEGKNKKK